MAYVLTVNGHDIEITHPDKHLFPDIPKEQVVAYYHDIAPVLLQHIQHRPITMHRFPNGIDQEGFYHKDVPNYFPEWIHKQKVSKKEGGTTTYAVCNDAATLVYLANYDCITPHTWLSTTQHITQPDRLIFDLDPCHRSTADLKTTAQRLKDTLELCHLTPYIMTTGSRGFHIVTPIYPEVSFDVARSFARDLTEYLAQQHPNMMTTALRKKHRDGRIFLDINRIAYAQTAAAAYSIRPKPGAPVATPICWDELPRHDLHPQTYTLANIHRRLGQIDDPWQDMEHQRASLSQAQEIYKTELQR